jgi:hypothetical protein
MAAKGDSKQGLVITLIFFVLLSILLGVLAYFGYAEQEQIAKERDKMKQEKSTAVDDREYYQFQALAYRAYMGHQSSDGQKELAQKIERYAPLDPQSRKRKLKADIKNPDRDDVAALLEKLEGEFGWNEAQKQPVTTYKGELTKRNTEIAELKNTVKNEQANAKKLSDKLKEANDLLASRQQQYKDELGKLKEGSVADLKKYVDQTADLQKNVADLGEQKTTLENANAEQENKHNEQLKALRKDLDDMEKRLTKVHEKLPPPNYLEYDRPKGRIVEIDRGGGLPFVDLGRADNAKPGLTFSIHGTDLNGRPRKESKGTLEILEVIGDRLSQARITSLRDERRDPVMKGDLLFNPVWSPGLKQHVAIAGIVDLTGDANKDNPAQVMRSLLEFKRLLEEQGVVVDAYLDVRERTIEGAIKGTISRQTDYLILGDAPDFPATLRDDAPGAARKGNMVDAMDKMEKDAERNGVQSIPLRRFLALSGIRPPRAVHSDSGTPPPIGRPIGTATPSPLDRQAPLPPRPDKPPAKDDREKLPK